MTLTQQIREHGVFLRACEGIPLMIAAIVLLSISAYLMKKS
jgi:hypothetical protein|nr:hypothetical protein [uncultured Methanoregula sp.]